MDQPPSLSSIVMRPRFGPAERIASHAGRVQYWLMRAMTAMILPALLSSAALSQTALKMPSFDLASVKPSQHVVGPDYNNQLTFSETGMKARNATLRRLVAEAYRLQLNQVIGPSWLDQNEYDIEAQAGRAVAK